MSDTPVRRPTRDGYYLRCVWCNGENYMMAVIPYSRGEVPCAAVHSCRRYLPDEYRKLTEEDDHAATS